jgi:hypothetical protein
MKHGLNTNFRNKISLFLISAALGVSSFAFVGCVPWYTVHEGTPKVVGERKDSEGNVTQQILRKVNNSSKEVLLTPEGPHKSVKFKDEYFLQENDKPILKLAFASDREFNFYPENANVFRYCDKFLALENSPLWVAVGIDSINNEMHIVVFDGEHILVHRTFKVIPKWKSYEEEFRMEKGNRTIKINSSTGLKKYDVIENSVTNLEQNPNNGK